MESAADRSYRRKQEARARQEARRANCASKATHISHLSHTPCTHTALWGPPSEWSPVWTDVYFGAFSKPIWTFTSFDCACDNGDAPG